MSPNAVSPSSFIVERVKISPDLRYTHDDDLIAAQNADPSTWNARRYPHFEGKSMREMYMLLGSAGHEVFRTSTPRYERERTLRCEPRLSASGCLSPCEPELLPFQRVCLRHAHARARTPLYTHAHPSQIARGVGVGPSGGERIPRGL